MSRRGPAPKFLFLSLSSILALRAFSAPEPFGVLPGSVVRWPGPGTTECQLENRRIEPVEGECLFAIDLLRAEGSLQVSRVRGGKREKATLRVQASPYPTERITLHDKYVQLKPKDLERVKREQKIVSDVLSRMTPPAFSLPFSRPLADAPRGKNFGVKRIFNGEARQPHNGIDYSVPTGTPVLATEGGRVALVADHFMPGRLVILDHGGGFFSMYLHLSKAVVAEGSAVKRGQILGLSGATGRVSGPHLHFGTRWQGARINPEQLYLSLEKWPKLPEDAAVAGENRHTE